MIEKDRNPSIWEGFHLPSFFPLNQKIKTEVCIIGGGITGVSTAYQLAKRGHQVVLLEAYSLGSGQTGRTTAHLSSQLEKEFSKLLKLHSEDSIKAFFKAHETAIRTIENIIDQEDMHCDFKKLDGYLFLDQDSPVDHLAKEQALAAELGIDLEYITETPLLKFKRPSLRFKNQGQFHPLKYLAGLVRALKDLGVKVYEGTQVREIKNVSPHETLITTDSGITVTSHYVIVATNTPVNNKFVIHTKQFAYRTYVMEFELTKAPLDAVLLWDTYDPYHYVRIVDHSLVVGGEDHRTGQDPKWNPFKHLEKWTRENFDIVGQVKKQWSGQIFEPSDQLAFIGLAPGPEENIFISTGESGIGMTSATLASLIIPDLIEKKSNDWAELFSPSRSVHGVGDLIKENMNVAFQYKDWLTPSEVKSVEDIPLDKGGLLRKRLVKTCVYHSEQDDFEKHSAVCPHLGGIVHWNDIEKTWDCPCHGSRFNTHGKVIEGPATLGLAE